ncbi:MAG: hypothetical protein JSW05_05860 [Candidatus Thorarchaeota archaeon]|nr:MAG: hypothetical protein JSW05_05860 [Candidatus Thorarchaeota archaeon]
MVQESGVEIWKNSLVAMRTSLASSYDMSTAVEEQRRFLKAWEGNGLEYIVFSDYRRNEGKRRLSDILEIIDYAIERIDRCDIRAASLLYLETLDEVALFSNWAKILERTGERSGS